MLVLDKHLDCFPWESTCLLKEYSVSRLPSIDLLEWQLGLDAAIPLFSQVDVKNLRYIIDPAVSKLTEIKKSKYAIKIRLLP